VIRLHHLETSRSHRILWLLEELGLPYELVRYRRDPQSLAAPAALKAIHPLGKSPLLEEEDGTVLAESGAIIEAVLDAHDPTNRLRPPAGTAALGRYRHWLHFAEGSAMPPLLLKLYLLRLGPGGAPALPRVDAQIGDMLDYVDGALAEAPFLAGPDFSAADIQMSFPMEAGVSRGGLTAERRHLWRWLEAMRARPAFQRAVEKGGPVMRT